MLVFTATGAQWRALRVDAKSALPIEDVVVLAGRVGASRTQLTGLGGRVKPSPSRLLLVLALPAAPAPASSPAVQVLEIGECAVQLLRDVRACFPSLVRRNPLAAANDSDDSDESSDDDASERPSRKRRKDDPTPAQPTARSGPSAATAAFLAATRVRVLPSAAALREAYAFEGDALARAVERDVAATATAMASACQLLCLEFPADAPSSPELNFGVVFAHAVADAPHTSQFLHIPLPREPSGFFTTSDEDEDDEHGVFQDATVFTLGARRESSAHGGGKTVEETIQNIRLRHASGTFVSLVLPALEWGRVVAEYSAALPHLQELQGELRSRRFMGVVPNREVTILLETK